MRFRTDQWDCRIDQPIPGPFSQTSAVEAKCPGDEVDFKWD